MIYEVDTFICETQELIFELAARNYDLNGFKYFVEQYMTGDFCRRYMDVKYSRFQYHEPEECMDFILPQIEDVTKLTTNGDLRYDLTVAGWIGYTYRYLEMGTHILSKDLFAYIPFDAMERSYSGFHSIEEENAADILFEMFIKQ